MANRKRIMPTEREIRRAEAACDLSKYIEVLAGMGKGERLKHVDTLKHLVDEYLLT